MTNVERDRLPWASFVAAINSRLPARRWRKKGKRYASERNRNLIYYEEEQRTTGVRSGAQSVTEN